MYIENINFLCTILSLLKIFAGRLVFICLNLLLQKDTDNCSGY